MKKVLFEKEEHKGVASTPHPDFGEYLSILLLEKDLTVESTTTRLAELIEPHPISEEMKVMITNQVNRKLIEVSKPTKVTKVPKVNGVSKAFLNQVTLGTTVGNRSSSLTYLSLLMLFADKVAKKTGRGKVRVPSRIREACADVVHSPTVFSAFIYAMVQQHPNQTVTAETVNRLYVLISGRNHNYTKPRQVLAHLKLGWDKTEIDLEHWLNSTFSNRAKTPPIKEEVAPPKVSNELSEQVQNLTEQVTGLVQQVANLTGVVQQLLAVKEADPDVTTFSMPKEELIQYLILNNKLNLTIQ